MWNDMQGRSRSTPTVVGEKHLHWQLVHSDRCVHALEQIYTIQHHTLTLVSRSFNIIAFALSTASGEPIIFTLGSFFERAPILSRDGQRMVHPVAAMIWSKKAWAGWLSPLPAAGNRRENDKSTLPVKSHVRVRYSMLMRGNEQWPLQWSPWCGKVTVPDCGGCRDGVDG